MRFFIITKYKIAALSFLVQLILGASQLSAQELSILVPYASQGPTDIAVRALARNMAIKYLKGVKVDNKLGESGLLGLRDFVNDSSIDSKLILLNSNTFLLAAVKEPRLLEGIRPISLIALSPMVLISSKSWRTMVAEANQKKSIKIGTSAPGSASHLCALQLAEAIGVSPDLVSYKGTAPLLQELFANNIEYACIEMSASLPLYISQGNITAVAISSDEAIATLPNIPTFESLGVNNITKGQWSILASHAKSSDNFNLYSADAVRSALQQKLNVPIGLFNFIPSEAVSNEKAIYFIQREFAKTKPYLSRLAN